MEQFYGFEVYAGKIAKPNIPNDHIFHLTQIALPVGATHPITLYVKSKSSSFAIATLDPQFAIYHLSVDLLFSPTQAISFTCKGDAGGVHLIGYTALADAPEDEDQEATLLGDHSDDDDLHNNYDDNEEELADPESVSPLPLQQQSKKANGAKPKQKRGKP